MESPFFLLVHFFLVFGSSYGNILFYAFIVFFRIYSPLSKMLPREDTLQRLLDFESSPTLFRANKTTGQLQQQQYLGFM